MTTAAWYAKGLRFECTRCGHCCTGASGVVRISDAEIERLARSLDLDPEQFRAMHTRTLRTGGVSLRERRGGDCVFYDRARGCRVYRERPLQCRSWPFWPSVLRSVERWREEASGCPGMNAGRLYSEDEIRGRGRQDAPEPGAP